MKYDHPTIKIEEPAPGYLVISGHQPQSFFIEDQGHCVPPETCIIPREIPPDLLRAIADAREGKAAAHAAVHPLLRQPQAQAHDLGEKTGGGDAPTPTLLDRVLNALAGGNIQVGKLAERLGVTSDAIKTLDGTTQAFHIAHAGWVKLGAKEGEA